MNIREAPLIVECFNQAGTGKLSPAQMEHMIDSLAEAIVRNKMMPTNPDNPWWLQGVGAITGGTAYANLRASNINTMGTWNYLKWPQELPDYIQPSVIGDSVHHHYWKWHQRKLFGSLS